MGYLLGISPSLLAPLPSYGASIRKATGVWMDFPGYASLTNNEKWVYSQVNIGDQAALNTQQGTSPNEHAIYYKLMTGASAIGNKWGITLADARAARGIMLDAQTKQITAVTISGTTTLTKAGGFEEKSDVDGVTATSGDEGRDLVAGGNIPSGTYITAVAAGGGSATVNQACTNGSGITINLLGKEWRGGQRGYGKETIFDPSVAGFATTFAAKLIAQMAADSITGPPVGVWMDQSGPDIRQYLGPPGSAVYPASLTARDGSNNIINSGIQAGRTQYNSIAFSSSPTSYAFQYRAFQRTVITALKAAGLFVAANIGGGTIETNDLGTDTLNWWNYYYNTAGDSPDMYTMEFWMRTGANIRKAGTGSFLYWQTLYTLPTWCYTRSLLFGGITEQSGADAALDSRAARYTRGTFLVTWDKSKSAPILRGYSDPWNEANIADGEIGYPTAAESVIATNVHFRPYDNGYVVVNASSASWTGTVPGHGSQTVASGDALIHVGP